MIHCGMDPPQRPDGGHEAVRPASGHDAGVPEPAIGVHTPDPVGSETLLVHLLEDLSEIRLHARQNSELCRLPDLLLSWKVEMIDPVAVSGPRKKCQRVFVGGEHLSNGALARSVHNDL